MGRYATSSGRPSHCVLQGMSSAENLSRMKADNLDELHNVETYDRSTGPLDVGVYATEWIGNGERVNTRPDSSTSV